MSITPTSGYTSGATFGAGFHQAQSDNMGQVDFMRLLVAQMKNQNPLEPQSNTDFMAQMAQFESLNQMRTVAKGMQIMQAMSELSAASDMIGKEITASQVNASGVVRDSVGREMFGRPYLRLTAIERADVDGDGRVQEAMADSLNAGMEVSGRVDKVVTGPEGIPLLMIGNKVVDLFTVSVIK